MSQYKFIVIGTKELVVSFSEAVIDSHMSLMCIISLRKSLLPQNSIDLSDYAISKNIPYHEIDDINDQYSEKIFKQYSPDFVISTWPKIIGDHILSIPNHFFIGTHPTKLPLNRGRHPLHWLIAMGISTSSFTFFRMNQRIDDGGIIVQLPFEIPINIDIDSLERRVDSLGYEGVCQICKMLLKYDSLCFEPQDSNKANYWRKRNFSDCIIDPRMSIEAVVRLVRSYSPPYPCAKLIICGHVLSVYRAVISSQEYKNVNNIEPGKILEISKRFVIIKFDDGVVKLFLQRDIPERMMCEKYIYPPIYYVSSERELIEDLNNESRIRRSPVHD